MTYIDGYIEEAEDDSDLFRDPLASTKAESEKEIDPELLWYLGQHPEKKNKQIPRMNQQQTVMRINRLLADQQL